MSTRQYPIHTVSAAPPAAPIVGDEWFNPTTNILYKFVPVDGVPNWISLSTGIFLTVPTKTAATRQATNGNLILNSETSAVNIYANNSWVTSATIPFTADYLVVAGGGGGAGGQSGVNEAGGGGAGGLLSGSLPVYIGTSYTITIGAGGSGGSTGANGVAGSNSSVGSITALGGGFGGRAGGGSGGSGGGTYTGSPGIGTAGPPRQGYDGAGGGAAPGGGGGAGGPGIVNGSGGPGQEWPAGSGTYYAGGGGSSYGNGGIGGGGNGGISGTVGTVNTGGGGGAGISTNNTWGSTGGSGVVILRYPILYPAASTTTGAPTIILSGKYRYYKFTSSGTITF